jgi:hypothetical protein
MLMDCVCHPVEPITTNMRHFQDLLRIISVFSAPKAHFSIVQRDWHPAVIKKTLTTRVPAVSLNTLPDTTTRLIKGKNSSFNAHQNLKSQVFFTNGTASVHKTCIFLVRSDAQPCEGRGR